jgi:diguanylate cyclase (GGDEF)-like protein
LNKFETIESIFLCVDDLPTLPGVALKILEAFQKPEPDIQQIGDILSTDPPLTAKILKLVNSSFYGLATKITAVHHAIKLLGIKTVKNLALSFALIDTFQSYRCESIDYKRFWKDSLIGATAAKLIAEKLEPGWSDDAFFLGLLQDIGSLILAHCMPGQYALVLNEVGQNTHIHPQSETRVFGFDHQLIGEYLTKTWELPNTFYLPIGYHHNPDELPPVQASILSLTRILHLSSLFIGLMNDNDRALSLWTLKETINKLKFSSQLNIDQVCDEINQKTQEVFPIFDLEVGKDEYIQIVETARLELSKLSVEMIHHLAEQKKEIAALKKQVIRDSMTQLYNHHHFRQLLQGELTRAERYNRPLALIFADIDRFKLINDTFGHLAGDRVIKALATKLKLETRQSDHVARYGGEEFAVILPETGIEDAMLIAERLRSEVDSMQITHEDKLISPTMSFGITGLSGKKKADINELINQADNALYRAKAQGRNRCCFHAQ